MKILIALAIMLILDMIWFSQSVPLLYQYQFDKINNTTTNYRIFPFGIYAWVCMAFGLIYFCKSSTTTTAFINGALLGLVIYGTYNGTNYATIHEWNINTIIFDNIWGIILCGTTNVLLHIIDKKNIIT